LLLASLKPLASTVQEGAVPAAVVGMQDPLAFASEHPFRVAHVLVLLAPFVSVAETPAQDVVVGTVAVSGTPASVAPQRLFAVNAQPSAPAVWQLAGDAVAEPRTKMFVFTVKLFVHFWSSSASDNAFKAAASESHA